jgi:hypothetical protein
MWALSCQWRHVALLIPPLAALLLTAIAPANPDLLNYSVTIGSPSAAARTAAQGESSYLHALGFTTGPRHDGLHLRPLWK